MYKDVLIKAGLKAGEAEIYDLLLQKGDASAQEINKNTPHKRGMVYKFLEDLHAKGLVVTYSKNKKTYFRAEHPYKLLELVEQDLQQKKIQQATLEATLPQLVSTFTAMQNMPGVRVFEGIEGIKEVYNDTLRDHPDEILGVLQTSEVEPEIYTWLTTIYAPLRAKENIFAKVITVSDSKLEKYIEKNEEEKRETRVIPKSKFPIAVEMNIYGSKVAFMNFKKGDKHIGIIINNKLIADSMRSIFDLAWERAGEY